jgi:hypothetical protein
MGKGAKVAENNKEPAVVGHCAHGYHKVASRAVLRKKRSGLNA